MYLLSEERGFWNGRRGAVVKLTQGPTPPGLAVAVPVISTRLSLPILEGGVFLHLFRFSLMSLSNIFLVMSYICFC